MKQTIRFYPRKQGQTIKLMMHELLIWMKMENQVLPDNLGEIHDLIEKYLAFKISQEEHFPAPEHFPASYTKRLIALDKDIKDES